MLRQISLGAAAAMLLAGCAYDSGPHGYAVAAGDYDGYYDDFYGPFDDGYWGPDNYFYYSNGGGHFRRDNGHHFRHDSANGFHSFHSHHGGGAPGGHHPG